MHDPRDPCGADVLAHFSEPERLGNATDDVANALTRPPGSDSAEAQAAGAFPAD